MFNDLHQRKLQFWYFILQVLDLQPTYIFFLSFSLTWIRYQILMNTSFLCSFLMLSFQTYMVFEGVVFLRFNVS